MIKNNYVCDVKYITPYTNQYATRSQMADGRLGSPQRHKLKLAGKLN